MSEVFAQAPARPRSAGRRGPTAARASGFLGGSAPLLVIAVAVSVQSGAAVATRLFAALGPLGTVWLRSGFAVVVLLPFAWRPLSRLSRRDWLRVLGLGVVLAAMNACFFEAIARAPLGAVATIEFAGPLLVAVAGSRGAVEYAAVALAATGVVLLGAPGSVGGAALALALGAAACWAAYIVGAKRLVADVAPLAMITGALSVGAVLYLPVAILQAGGELGRGSVLARGLAVGVLSSALPYVLELAALRLVSASAFSVLLSLEPAVAAAVGLVALGQHLRPLEIAAVACVVVGSALASRRARTPPLG